MRFFFLLLHPLGSMKYQHFIDKSNEYLDQLNKRKQKRSQAIPASSHFSFGATTPAAQGKLQIHFLDCACILLQGVS